MKRVFANEQWCIDCGRCEVACKTAHSRSSDTVKAYRFEAETAWSRIRLEGDATLSFAMNCRHCENPRCVESCISGALGKDTATGLVLVDERRCVACGTCVSACPFGCITVRPSAKKSFAHKCDLCATRGAPGEPVCVVACPNNALMYAEEGTVA